MKKRLLALAMLVLIFASAFSLTGCANKMLYGTWKLMQTGDPATGEYKDYDFIFPVVVDVRNDGTIYMMDSLFGTYEKDGKEFSFWYNEDGEKGELMTGAWEMIGSDLYIYPDEEAVIYKLSRVQQATPTPTVVE